MTEGLDAIRCIGGIPRYWARITLAARALREEGEATSFAGLMEYIDAAKGPLLARQVRAGGRMMLVGEDSVAYVALIFAVAEFSAWPVIVNARLSARELQVIRAHCVTRLEVFIIGVSPEAARMGRLSVPPSMASRGDSDWPPRRSARRWPNKTFRSCKGCPRCSCACWPILR